MTVVAVVLFGGVAMAQAKPSKGPKESILAGATYPDMTTYSCRTDAIPIYRGQNTNLFGNTKTCPNAQTIKGPGDTSIFDPGSTAEGYVTRFRPSMVEIKPSGKLVTPSVWDLHLHHVVWLAPNGGPTFASGEEKTIVEFPQGYGLEVKGDSTWGLNYMIHNLGSTSGRKVYITWEITWVPKTDPPRTDINPARVQWLDVAGVPQIYPVFDAKRSYDSNGDGRFVFPDEVSADPSDPSYAEREKISGARAWTLKKPETLVFGAGHLHPGGLSVDLQVARDGPDAGTIDGDDPSEVRELFRSNARYYEPAGAVSWDVSMGATRRDWRISLKTGDTVSIKVTYDVRKASWYEAMGILPLVVSDAYDPQAKDPYDDEAAVKAMYDKGGILTHGRLPENIDAKANQDLKLPDPRDLKPSRKNVAQKGISIDGFLYSAGGYSAIAGFPASAMRPPTIRAGQTVTFTNEDALFDAPDENEVWHSITSCKAPCNRGSGIGYPLASGPIDFDSGQLGFGDGTSAEVTTQSSAYTTPALTNPGTYTYFCRIHPFMRGAIRVKGQKS